MKGYLSKIPIDKDLTKTKLSDKHIRHKYHQQNHDREVAKLEQATHTHTVHEFQKLLGQVLWVARTLPDLAYCVGEISRRSTIATKEDVSVLMKLVQLANQRYTPLVLQAVDGDWMLLGTSDAAYDIRTFEGRIGYQVKLVATNMNAEDLEVNILSWSSRTLKNKLASTTEAELHALAKVIKIMPLYIDLVLNLTGRAPSVVYEVDSKPLMSQLQSEKSASEPALQGLLSYVCQEREKQKAVVKWIPTNKLSADRYTKWKL
eukprot:GHVR01138160.1.p1 GENE.GHVR01138160.1~~GHVR01138160.1.p1  ORF type:complete len:261 (-),score=35.54 GHVR01138160.1:122-904(-)